MMQLPFTQHYMAQAAVGQTLIEKSTKNMLLNDSLLEKKQVQKELSLLDDDLEFKEPKKFSILRSFAALGMIERKTVSFNVT